MQTRRLGGLVIPCDPAQLWSRPVRLSRVSVNRLLAGGEAGPAPHPDWGGWPDLLWVRERVVWGLYLVDRERVPLVVYPMDAAPGHQRVSSGPERKRVIEPDHMPRRFARLWLEHVGDGRYRLLQEREEDTSWRPERRKGRPLTRRMTHVSLGPSAQPGCRVREEGDDA